MHPECCIKYTITICMYNCQKFETLVGDTANLVAMAKYQNILKVLILWGYFHILFHICPSSAPVVQNFN